MVVRRIACDTGVPAQEQGDAAKMPMRGRETIASVGVDPCRKPFVTLKPVGYVSFTQLST